MIIGVLLYLYFNSKQEIKFKPTPTAQPSTAVDKGIETVFNQSEYTNDSATSEKVVLTIKNTTQETYYLYGPTCAAGMPYVKYIGPDHMKNPLLDSIDSGNWKIAISSPCNMMPHLYELNPNDNYTFEWNQINYTEPEDINPKEGWAVQFVPTGDYRMVVSLFKEKKGDNRYVEGVDGFEVVSQPFRITSQSREDRINISSPKEGDSWQRDNTYDIKWKGVKSDNVNIYFVSERVKSLGILPEQIFEIAKDVPNTGKYAWTVRPDFMSDGYGLSYMIKITESVGNGVGYSEPFTITKPSIIKFSSARGDFVDPGPIEDECQLRLRQYKESNEFKNWGYASCEIKVCKVGNSEKECPNGFSPMGCSIIEFECK